MIFSPNHHIEFLAIKLAQRKLIKTRLDSPNQQGFRLKLHEKNPDAPLSPYYVDFRGLRSYPPLPRYAAEALQQLIITHDLGFDLVADVPTAATPLVTLLSDIRQTPMITPREPKTHGSQSSIDGVFKKNQKVLLIDDLVTKADSKIASAEILRTAGLIVTDVAVLLDREQGGKDQLVAHGLTLHAVWTISELLTYYQVKELISAELVAEINAYRASVA